MLSVSVLQAGPRSGKRREDSDPVGFELGFSRHPRGASGLWHNLLTLRPPLRRCPGDHRQPYPCQPRAEPPEDHRRGRWDGLQETPQVRPTCLSSRGLSHLVESKMCYKKCFDLTDNSLIINLMFGFSFLKYRPCKNMWREQHNKLLRKVLVPGFLVIYVSTNVSVT